MFKEFRCEIGRGRNREYTQLRILYIPFANLASKEFWLVVCIGVVKLALKYLLAVFV
jgi:hypothetical protein